MPIDKKLIKRLKPGFDYLEEYDRYGKKPNKRVPVCVTIPLRLKRKIEKMKNISSFVERAIEHEINRM